MKMNKKGSGAIVILILILVLAGGWYFFIYQGGVINKIDSTDYSISCNNNGSYYKCICNPTQVEGYKNQYAICGSYEFVELYPIPISINNNIHFRDSNGIMLNLNINNCMDFINSQGMTKHNNEFWTDNKYLFSCYKNYLVVTNFELLNLNKIPI